MPRSNDHGPIDLHLADGFAGFSEVDARSVVRKALRGGRPLGEPVNR